MASLKMDDAAAPEGTVIAQRSETLQPGDGARRREVMASADIEETVSQDLYLRAQGSPWPAGQWPDGWECPTCRSVGPLCPRPMPTVEKGNEWKPLTVWCSEVMNLRRLEGVRHSVPDLPAGIVDTPEGKVDGSRMRLTWVNDRKGEEKEPRRAAFLSKKSKGKGKGKDKPKPKAKVRPEPLGKTKTKRAPHVHFVAAGWGCAGKQLA